MGKPAVFWDRDDTLIADPGYLNHPDQVRLIPGAAEALRRTTAAGFENVVITNQSGVARGLIDEPTLKSIHERVHTLLAEAGARLDAIYYCPFLPGDEAVVPEYRQDSDLRKPKPGMLLKASLERKIELVASWMIGDSLRDTQAGRSAGCRTILLRNGKAAASEQPKDTSVDFTANTLSEAVDIVLKHTRKAEKTAASVEPATPADPAAILQEILTFLKMADRRAQSEDFALPRLAGAVIQIMAIGAMLWAIFGWLIEPGGIKTQMDQLLALQTGTTRLLFAVILQLMALTCFTASSRKR
ncbi:MAG TPA: HAD family hydrolase [Phycisphaerae bacterium]|nr:HAD family hydrolase [Phycisphaerae bacterium]HRY66859.1 HAD family hydrolase [Phycisphaerae bacterium]HSA26917.1 HAD family hydrolase [Phycisphaerae bacterium]